jgi:hypothetical protein
MVQAELGRVVREHASDLRERAVERICASCYLDAATTANLRVGVSAAIDRWLVRLGDPDQPIDTELFAAHGRAQQIAGRTLDEMLSFYHVATAAFYERAAILFADMELPAEAALELAENGMKLVGELTEAAVAGFLARDAEAARQRRDARAQLWEALVREPPCSPGDLLAASERADWPLPRRVRVAVARSPKRLPPRASGASAGDRALVAAHEPGMCAVLVPDEHGAEQLLERVATSLGISGPLVIGPPVGSAEAAHSLTCAATLLTHLDGKADGLIRCEDRLVELLLASSPVLTHALVESELAPLDDLSLAHRERMLATLRGWVDFPGQPQSIAHRLGLHVQTVRYRLRQLRELFGDALDDPDARLGIALALRCAPLPETSGH